jgi:hypothetical protein
MAASPRDCRMPANVESFKKIPMRRAPSAAKRQGRHG